VAAPADAFWRAMIRLQGEVLQLRRRIEERICALHGQIAAVERRLAALEDQRP
jgi:hypothetical protein